MGGKAANGRAMDAAPRCMSAMNEFYGMEVWMQGWMPRRPSLKLTEHLVCFGAAGTANSFTGWLPAFVLNYLFRHKL